jgi:hypothetical protein
VNYFYCIKNINCLEFQGGACQDSCPILYGAAEKSSDIFIKSFGSA